MARLAMVLGALAAAPAIPAVVLLPATWSGTHTHLLPMGKLSSKSLCTHTHTHTQERERERERKREK
jgi:hypothetical protein